MAFELRRTARQKVRYNNANDDVDLIFQLVENGEKVTPTSATIEVFKPSSTTAVLAPAAMTVSGSLLTYNLNTTTVANFPVDQGYRADIIVTVGSETHERHIIFDVVEYLFTPNIGYDQLVAIDDGIRGMQHDGDPDLAALIAACRSEIELEIETKMLGSRRMRTNDILDASQVATPFVRYCLAQFWRNKGEPEKADMHEKTYWRLWRAVLGYLEADRDNDGKEDSSGDVVQTMLRV